MGTRHASGMQTRMQAKYPYTEFGLVKGGVAEEMAQQARRALAALPGSQGLVSSIHVVAHNNLPLQLWF